MLDTSYTLTTELVVRKILGDPQTMEAFYLYNLLPMSTYGAPALQEVISLTINSEAINSGSISITLPGSDTITFDIAGGSSANAIALIIKTFFYKEWATDFGQSNNIVIFTKKIAGYQAGVPSFIDINQETEINATFEIIRQGTSGSTSSNTPVLSKETKEMLYALGNLLIVNDEYIVSNDIENLLDENFLLSDFQELFQRTNVPLRIRQLIFYNYKYAAVKYFFQKNYSHFLPASELEEINSREKVRIFLKSILREFDKFSDIIVKLYEINDIDRVDEEYIIYIAQLLGYEKEDQRITTNVSFRHFIKNITEIYKIKGTNYAFELYLNFLGFVATIHEFWFDRRYYYSLYNKNPWTNSTDIKDFGWYLTPTKPNEGMPYGVVLEPELITQENITSIRNLYEFNRLLNSPLTYKGVPVNNPTPRQLLGYSPFDNPEYYNNGETYTYFKTNYMIYEISKIDNDGIIQQVTAEEVDLLVKYLDIFTPIFIMKNIYLSSVPYDTFVDLDIFEDDKVFQHMFFPAFDTNGNALIATREISDLLTTGTNSTTMVFENTKYFSPGQEIYVYVGSTDVLRGRTRIVSGLNKTWIVSPSIAGMTSGDGIQVRDKNILSSNLSLEEVLNDVFDYGADYYLKTLLAVEEENLNRLYDYNSPKSFFTVDGNYLENVIDSSPVVPGDGGIITRGWKTTNTTIGDIYKRKTSFLKSLVETKVQFFYKGFIETTQPLQYTTIFGKVIQIFGPVNVSQNNQTAIVTGHVVSNYGPINVTQSNQTVSAVAYNNSEYYLAIQETDIMLGEGIFAPETPYTFINYDQALIDGGDITQEIINGSWSGEVIVTQEAQDIEISGVVT